MSCAGMVKNNLTAYLRRPYNEDKWDSRAGGLKHKSNVVLWNYRLEREKKGKQHMKKQHGITAFYSFIRKRSEISDK